MTLSKGSAQRSERPERNAADHSRGGDGAFGYAPPHRCLGAVKQRGDYRRSNLRDVGHVVQASDES